MIRDAGNGYFVADGLTIKAFPGYDLALECYQTGSLNVVAAGPGGGPRRLVSRRFTNPPDRLIDGWVPGYDPNTWRGGVAVDVPPEVPLTRGSGYPIWVSFEFPYAGSWAGDVFDRLTGLVAGLNVRLTTARPNTVLCAYGQCVISTTIEGFPGSDSLRTAGGPCTDRFALPYTNADWDTSLVVLTVAMTDVNLCAAIAAHEIGHGFGEQHTNDVGDLMNGVVGPLPTSVFSQATRARILARTAGFR